MANKLVENLDEITWNRFVGHCKAEKVLVGNRLTDILIEYLEKQGRDPYTRYIENEQPNYAE